MADDPTKRGPPDRDRVSQQPHEVAYLAKRTRKPRRVVASAVRSAGPLRKEVIRSLTKRSP